MRSTITKTVSMMLVTVMVLGVVAMPMRASAGLESLTPARVWLEIFNITQDIAKQMLNPINNSPNTSAISRFSAFFESTLQEDLLYVSAEQMNELSYWLAQNGISVYPTSVPGRNLIALCVQNTSVFIPAIDTTIQLDVNVGDMYTYSGKTIVRIPGGSAAEEDRDSYSGNGSTSNNVGIGDDGQLVDVPTTDKDTGTTVGGGTFIHNETTNNWQVKNENGTYVDIEEFYYNPVTQTYHTTTNEWNSTTNNYDNRQYTYQFYYDYTYITYIGSSAEYREAYKVYFELPDGRSSGDLTADELKGISLQFDMVNYDKAASDTLTQALFPFDGNLDNEAYYNATAQWVVGASTEYLESPDGFGGNLVYNSGALSRLNINLDGNISNEWTIQFRYYCQGPTNSINFGVGAWGIGDLLGVASEVWDGFSGSGLTRYAPKSGLTPLESGFPLIWFSGNDVYPGYTPSIVGSSHVGTMDGSLYSSIATLTPGQWYDIAICYYRDPSFAWGGASYWQTNTPKYYIYINGILVASYNIGFYQNVEDSSDDYVDWTTGYYYRAYSETSTSMTSRNAFTLNSFGYHSKVRMSPMIGVSNLSGIFFVNGKSGGPLFYLDNLRILNTALYTGVQSFTPSPVPFSPNLVYVLPSVAGLNDNTVAIMSQLPVSGYRVGGVRPTDPTLATGYIYMHIDGDFVDSVQQWNGAYWEEVTARLYTGLRWIPVTAFNVFTLEDMFDIIDPDADGSGPGVDSIFQYYLWWSGEWGSFQEWLKGTMQTLIEAIQASGGGGGSTDAPVVIVPGVNDQTTTSEITTENPDGSTTKTTIVSNAAGLVYSNSVTTYPTDVNGNTKTITVYTDSSGVMYQTETVIDKDGNVTVTEPTKATGTLGSILKMITGGVMEIAGTVIEGFVTIVVDGVKFIIEAADGLFEGIGDLFTTMFGAVTDFTDSVQDYVNPPGSVPALDGDDDEQGDGDGGQAINIFDAFFQVLPDWLVTGLTLCFVMMIVFPLMNKIHF